VSIQKIRDPCLFFQPLKLQIWYTTWVWDYLTKKQRLGLKLAEAWARGASEKNWDPLFISETVEASD